MNEYQTSIAFHDKVISQWTATNRSILFSDNFGYTQVLTGFSVETK